MARPTFSLRFTHDRLRELVRVVAEREGISQNELLEQAAEHEVVARGALVADELEVAAAQLRAATGPVAAARMESSIAAYVEREALPDPIRPRRISRHAHRDEAAPSKIGAVAAFKHG
ncbi:MAG: hypothetical protein ACR2MO_12880 [Acidimicrobiales bacterium]